MQVISAERSDSLVKLGDDVAQLRDINKSLRIRIEELQKELESERLFRAEVTFDLIDWTITPHECIPLELIDDEVSRSSARQKKIHP